MTSVNIFQRGWEKLLLMPLWHMSSETFFSHEFSVCKTFGFFLPTEVSAKYQINDERYADKRIPSVN
jgi:hypothetical protein